MKEDFYDILGILKDVMVVEIKKVYCKKVIEFYLDKNFGDVKVEEMFKKVVEVYEVFSDLDKKVCYD